ncbi:ABC transporter permease [Streptococcus gallolyticus]|nr:ABC transporter permease [Streptococcus gallolyticus]MBY5040120.1 ABC transporter permease [Streptococcus gallolyticus]
MKLSQIEKSKYKGKHLFLLLALFAFLEFLLCGVQLFSRQGNQVAPEQAILLTVDAASLYHVILLPIFLASLASMSIQLENRHQMWKILQVTGLRFSTIIATKFAYIFGKVCLLQISNALLFGLLLHVKGLLEDMPWERFIGVQLGTLLVSMAVLMMHFFFSLYFSNQLISLSIALIGSLVSIILLFIPAGLYHFSPYSWYGLLMNLNPNRVGGHFVYQLREVSLYPYLASLALLVVFAMLIVKGKKGNEYV